MLRLTNHFNISSLTESGVRLIGNDQAPVHIYWEKLLGMIRKDELEPLKMVSHRVLIEELDIVYQKFNTREKGIQKVFVQIRFPSSPSADAPKATSFKSIW
jgi:threonine dehydrogenase-like Zn-dependent dehydrogenase